MTFRVLKTIHYPAAGHVPPFGQPCAPEHVVTPEIGATVDLSHLSDVARDFFLRNGCIESVAATPADHEEGGN